MARAVRISRLPGAGGEEGEKPGVGETNRPAYRPNTHALTRAGRLFAIYLVALVVILVLFLGVLIDTPTGGSGSGAYLLLALLAAVLAVAGFALTLVRTPRGVEMRGDGFVVTEFLGTRRVFPHRGLVDLHVENRYPGGWLAPAPTQVLALSTPSGPTRRYLVELNLIPGSDVSRTD